MSHTHDYFSGRTVDAQTGRASTLLIGTLVGGVLALSSYPAGWLYGDPFYRDIVAAIAAILLGLPIVLEAFNSLRRGHAGMDRLAAIAICAAFAKEYYQVAAVVSFFFHLSNLIEKRTALGARASIESLIRLTPKIAHLLLDDGSEQEIQTSELRPGNVIRVRPGDNVPADGEVIGGESTVSQASITGESLPVDKALGDEVFSGTVNLTGSMDIRVTRAGADTTLGRVQKLILKAEQTQIPVMRIIEKYSSWYEPTVLMLALIVLFFTRQWEPFIAILIVACPCALILATPTAMVAGLACAARLGILIKSVESLEIARNISAVVFDKTGTLTTGELAVTRLKPAGGIEAADLLSVAASIEQHSKHPVAKAVMEVARKTHVTVSDPTQFAEVPGMGVKAQLGQKQVLLGRRRWLEEQDVDMSPIAGDEYIEPEGISVLYVASDGKCIGWVGLEDRTREEARDAIDQLRQLGIKHLTMVTGDRWSVAKRVAAEMGCSDVHAEVLPQDKLALVDQLKRSGYTVAVVGDGINDAPALAAGDLGVAMGAAGSDVAINSASIALMNNDLKRLPFLIRLSRATVRVVRQNLGFGVLVIATMMLLASLQAIGPITAVILHTIGSAVVIFNSARLVRFGEQPENVETALPTINTAVAST